jgi:hypothetical protein
MKRIAILITLMSFLLASCKKGRTEQDVKLITKSAEKKKKIRDIMSRDGDVVLDIDENTTLSYSSANDPEYVSVVKGFYDTLNVDWDTLQAIMGLGSLSFNTLDTNNMRFCQKNNEDAIALTALYNASGTTSDSIAYAFTCLYDGQDYSYPMLIKSKKGTYIKFIDLATEEVLTIDINPYFHTASGSTETHEFRNGTSIGQVGQCVINCINDAYSMHSWASIWAFFQTIVIPQTASAIFGACLYHCTS